MKPSSTTLARDPPGADFSQILPNFQTGLGKIRAWGVAQQGDRILWLLMTTYVASMAPEKTTRNPPTSPTINAIM